jgi:predicted nuclease with TOPRIM domain
MAIPYGAGLRDEDLKRMRLSRLKAEHDRIADTLSRLRQQVRRAEEIYGDLKRREMDLERRLAELQTEGLRVQGMLVR